MESMIDLRTISVWQSDTDSVLVKDSQFGIRGHRVDVSYPPARR